MAADHAREADESPMALEQYLAFTIAMAIYVVTPGPGVMAVVARALADGLRATIPHMLGIITGNLAYLSASIFGLAWIARQMGESFLLVKIAGGAYLIWLGVRMWRSGGDIASFHEHRSRSFLSTFFTGLMITASNPKAILFYLAVLPAVLDTGAADPKSLAAIALINSSVLALIVGGYALVAAQVRQLFKNSASVKRLNKGAGSIMIAAGCGIAAS